MDRFTSTMIALCVIACLIIMVIAFGTSSAIIARLVGWDYGYVNYARDYEPPQDADSSRPTRIPPDAEPVNDRQSGDASRDNATGSSASGLAGQDASDSPDSPDGLPLDDFARDIPDAHGSDGGVRISPFVGISDEKKNEYWWEIARAARRQDADGQIKFNLDFATANNLARRFGCTSVELMEFFQDGALADWLQDEPKKQ